MLKSANLESGLERDESLFIMGGIESELKRYSYETSLCPG